MKLILASIDLENDKFRQAWNSKVDNRMKIVKEGKPKLFDFKQLYIEKGNS